MRVSGAQIYLHPEWGACCLEPLLEQEQVSAFDLPRDWPRHSQYYYQGRCGLRSVLLGGQTILHHGGRCSVLHHDAAQRDPGSVEEFLHFCVRKYSYQKSVAFHVHTTKKFGLKSNDSQSPWLSSTKKYQCYRLRNDSYVRPQCVEVESASWYSIIIYIAFCYDAAEERKSQGALHRS